MKRSMLFQLEILFFFYLFGRHFDCPGSGSVFAIRIQIQIHGSHITRDPHGPGSRSATLEKSKADNFAEKNRFSTKQHNFLQDISNKREEKTKTPTM